MKAARRCWPPCAAPALRCEAQRGASLAPGSAPCVLREPALGGATAVCRPQRDPAAPRRSSGARWPAPPGSAASPTLRRKRHVWRRWRWRWARPPGASLRRRAGLWRRRLPRRERALHDRHGVLIRLVRSAVVLASYGAVARAVWGMRSSGDQRKAVDTRGSPLTAGCLFLCLHGVCHQQSPKLTRKS